MKHLIVKESGADISEDRRFRTRLWRIWNANFPPLLFIGLNPSTAGPEVNDPTINWLVCWASGNNFGSLHVGNLYAFRATDPKDLKAARYPVGRGNDEAIAAMARGTLRLGGRIACGWGAKAQPNRALDVAADLQCLGRSRTEPVLHRWGVNKNGSPKHPLYLPRSSVLESWSVFA